jgi:hypothetical protein
MQNFTSSKKVLWFFLAIGIIAIVVILIAGLVYRNRTPGNGGLAGTNQPAPKLDVQQTKVPNDKLPDKFPASLPIEQNAKVIDNFNSTASNGNFQATRQYESAKSPADNYKTFEAFFKKDGWTTLSAANTATDRNITVQKDKTIIQALFFTNTVSKASVAKISVTILP